MKCSICKTNLPKGTGKMLIKNDGRIFYFCNSKCQKNFDLGRTEKKIKWVKKAKATT
ncbi:MAG: 50S ribosomal protein L24e [Candidatus Aenigmarchaeota archaeon]|nr:50S ribosomal protein L24e [Candidatus Aenigmarchaeota archaeon]